MFSLLFTCLVWFFIITFKKDKDSLNFVRGVTFGGKIPILIVRIFIAMAMFFTTVGGLIVMLVNIKR